MTAKLAHIEKVRSRGQISDTPETNQLVQIALEQATLQLQELFESNFDRATNVVDQFFYNLSDYYNPRLPNHLHLRLNTGFLFEDVGFTTSVKLASTRPALSSAAAVDSDDVIVDLVRGQVTITGTTSVELGSSVGTIAGIGYAQVTYHHGFELETDVPEDPYGPYYTGVPVWLENLAADLAYNRYVELMADTDLPKLPGASLQATIHRYARTWNRGLDPLTRA